MRPSRFNIPGVSVAEGPSRTAAGDDRLSGGGGVGEGGYSRSRPSETSRKINQAAPAPPARHEGQVWFERMR